MKEKVVQIVHDLDQDGLYVLTDQGNIYNRWIDTVDRSVYWEKIKLPDFSTVKESQN